MDFTSVLNEIKPSESEKKEIYDISNNILDYLSSFCKENNINSKIYIVGSVAKGTYLKGKSDIDIFIAFPLETPVDELKETGLFLGYECSKHFRGKASEHYASHPYVTSEINGFEVDFVPCYKIRNGNELKSAVDRTILHTKYVKKHLEESQKDEVLLLKRFMDMTGTYGSEFKVGGFAGYLCELLIIKYGNFENTLKEASKWRYGEVIDLEDYGTYKQFKDPLRVIDPTDKNRNVAAALRLDKMSEFIQASRNYLNSDNKINYFFKPKDKSKNLILDEINKRGNNLIAIKFNIPDIPLDTLHPQLRKTAESLAQKMDNEDFKVFNYDYWTNEKDSAVLIFEMLNTTLNKVKLNIGPKIFIEKACQQFIEAHGIENCHVKDDFLVEQIKRPYITAEEFVEHIFTYDNISLIKVGKNLIDEIINSYSFVDIINSEFSEDFYIFLDDFLNPGKYIRR